MKMPLTLLLLLILKKQVVVYLHYNYKNIIINMFLTTFRPFFSSFPATNTYQILHFLTFYSLNQATISNKSHFINKKKKPSEHTN